MEFFIILLVAVAVFGFKSFVVIPQQEVHVVERLGRFHRALTAGLNILIPFIDRVAYRHSLKEIPLDVPSQVCITRDNTQLTVDGIIYFQVTDPKLASYGSSNYIMAITQLAQTTLRSVIGRMELDKTFEERDEINSTVVAALDEAAGAWGVKVLRYEIKDLVPPQEILRSMQAQITAERENAPVSPNPKVVKLNKSTLPVVSAKPKSNNPKARLRLRSMRQMPRKSPASTAPKVKRNPCALLPKPMPKPSVKLPPPFKPKAVRMRSI